MTCYLSDFLASFRKLEAIDKEIRDFRYWDHHLFPILHIFKLPKSIRIGDVEAKKYLVLDIRREKKRDLWIHKIAYNLALVRLYEICKGISLGGSYDDVVGLIIWLSKGYLERLDTSFGTIYIATPDKLEILRPFKPLVEPSRENIEEAIEYLREHIKADITRVHALRHLIGYTDQDDLKLYHDELLALGSVLIDSDELYPVTGQGLAEAAGKITRKMVLEAIKKRYVLLLEPEDVLALYNKGLITKEDFRRLVSEGYFRIRSVDDLLKLAGKRKV